MYLKAFPKGPALSEQQQEKNMGANSCGEVDYAGIVKGIADPPYSEAHVPRAWAHRSTRLP